MIWPQQLKTLLLFLFFACCAASVGMAQTQRVAERAILILDASGSMWGQIAGKSKMSIARQSIKDAVSGGLGQLELGLMAYGHRKKTSCSDVQLVSPVLPMDVGRFSKALGRVKPLGRTPITAALQRAAKALDYKNRKATIILLSDGFENCRKDPCQATRALKKEGLDFAIHVIGFGKAEKELKKLRCVAENSEGVFIRAKTGAELKAALGERLTDLAVGVPAGPDGKPLLGRGETGLMLSAVLSEGGTPIENRIHWQVFGGQSGADGVRKEIGEEEAAQLFLKLPAGKYLVTASFGPVEKSQEVEVLAKGLTAQTLVLNAGIIKVSALAMSGGEPLEDMSFELFNDDDAKNGGGKSGDGETGLQLRSSNPETLFLVPAGSYHVIARHGLAKVERSVTVEAGASEDVRLVMNIGTLQLGATALQDGPALRDLFFTVYPAGITEGSGVGELMRTAASEPQLQLPAGDYEVVVEHDLVRKRERVTVFPGRVTRRVVVLNAGILALSSRIAGSDDRLKDKVSYRIFRRNNGNRAQITKTSRPSARLKMSSGRYEIVGKLGSVNVVATKQVTLQPGKTSHVVLDFKAGSVTLALVPRPGGIAETRVFWQLLDAKGDEIWRTSRPTPGFLLLAGSYTAIAQKGNQKYKQAFSVTLGTQKKLEIVAK